MDNMGKILLLGVGGTGKSTLLSKLLRLELEKFELFERPVDRKSFIQFIVEPLLPSCSLHYIAPNRFALKPILSTDNSELSTVKIEAKWEKVADELNKLYNGYVSTKDKSVLLSITTIISSLDKSTLKKLKRYFRPKIRSFQKSTVDCRKKIRSLILFITAYFSRVTGCEENNNSFLLLRKYILFSKQQNVVYVQQGRTNQINCRIYK
jgi:hypothetical protein